MDTKRRDMRISPVFVCQDHKLAYAMKLHGVRRFAVSSINILNATIPSVCCFKHFCCSMSELVMTGGLRFSVVRSLGWHPDVRYGSSTRREGPQAL